MKEKILQAALNQFNAHGVTGTSLRAIAAEAHISDGHLRYYFKTKEILLLELFSQLEEKLASMLPTALPSFSPETVVPLIENTYDFLNETRFFFVEAPLLFLKYPTVLEGFNQMHERRRTQMLEAFGLFKTIGFFRPNIRQNEMNLLYEQFFILTDNYVKYANFSTLKTIGGDDKSRFCRLCLYLFLPYLSENIKTRFETYVLGIV